MVVSMLRKCPDCDSHIEFCVEERVLHKRIIDHTTGKLKKRIKIESQGNEASHSLFQCTICSWSSTDGSGEFTELLASCNHDDRDELFEHVANKEFNSRAVNHKF